MNFCEAVKLFIREKKLQEFVSESLAEKGIDAASLHRWARQIEELQVLRGLETPASGMG